MFKKGYTPWNKGKKMSEEFCLTVSNALKGKIPKNIKLLSSDAVKLKRENAKKITYASVEYKERMRERSLKHRNHFFGKKHTIESKLKMSIAHKKNPSRFWLGKKRPLLSGVKHPQWSGGKETERQRRSFLEKRREIRKKINGGTHTLTEWNELKKKYNYMCLCCKRFEPEIKLTEDHIVPIFYGGKDTMDNIQPLCGECNSRKGIKTIYYITEILNYVK